MSDKVNNTANNSVNSSVLEFDIAIVGGGLAGYSCAVALQSLNVSVAIIDSQAPFGQVDSTQKFDDRALALAYSSIEFLQSLSVIEQLDNNALTKIKRIHVSDRGHSGFTRLSHTDAQVDFLGKVIVAKNLGAALASTLKSSKPEQHFQHFYKTQVTNIIHKKHYAELKLLCNTSTGNLTEDANKNLNKSSTENLIRAKLVIIADGGQSSLGSQLGINATRYDYGQVGVLANVTASQRHNNTAYERFTQNGPIALLPLRQQDYKLVWTVPTAQAKEVMAYSEAEFLSQLQSEFGDRAGIFERTGKRVNYPMFEVRKSNIQMGRAILIGNSAHALHPIAGQGFNLGLRDIQCLLKLLTVELKNSPLDSAAIYAVSKKYAEQRESDISRTTLFTDGLVRGFSNKSIPKALLRNLGLLTLDNSPTLKRVFLRRMLGTNQSANISESKAKRAT